MKVFLVLTLLIGNIYALTEEIAEAVKTDVKNLFNNGQSAPNILRLSNKTYSTKIFLSTYLAAIISSAADQCQ